MLSGSVFKRVSQLLAVTLSVGLAGCDLDLGPEDDGDGFGGAFQSEITDVTFAVLHQSSYLESGLEHDRSFRIFTDQESYEDELLNYSSNQAQSIDFDENQVILLDMGTRATSGYSVTVDDAYEQDGIVKLEINYVRPASSCSVNSAETNPYIFVRIQSSGEIVLEETLSELEC